LHIATLVRRNFSKYIDKEKGEFTEEEYTKRSEYQSIKEEEKKK